MAETLSPNDVVSCLWSKNANEKCRIGLADVIIYEGGRPQKWLITGKTGEITKKRSIDVPAITSRWSRIASQTDSPIMAIIRQQGGLLKFLTAEAWKVFTENIVGDNSVLSIHCFVKGANKIVYRNKFELRDKLGRFTTSTNSYNFQYETNTDAVSVMFTNNCPLVETRASSLKNIMDLATNTVVRYLELMLGIKIVSLSVDYVIDTKSQLWMLWTSEAVFVRGTNLNEISGVLSKGNPERMSWAGPKYAEGLLEAKDDSEKEFGDTLNSSKFSSFPVTPKSPHSPGFRRHSPTHSSPTNAGQAISPLPEQCSLQDLKDTNKSFRSKQGSNKKGKGSDSDSDCSDDVSVSKTKAGRGDATMSSSFAQLTAATSAIDDAIAASNRRKRVKASQNMQSTYTLVHSGNHQLKDNRKLPDPFICKGDYCKVKLEAIGLLAADEITKRHSVEKVFTDAEIVKLRKDKRFAEMMEWNADGPALAAISMKSIIMARNERRGMNVEDVHLKGREWERYPVSPRSRTGISVARALAAANGSNGGGGSALLEGGFSVASGMSLDEVSVNSQEEAHAHMLEKDKEHREMFTKTMASYYDQVRVCGCCYKMYALMDWSRDILGLSDAHGAGLEAAAGGPPKHESLGATILAKVKTKRNANRKMSPNRGENADNETTVDRFAPPPLSRTQSPAKSAGRQRTTKDTATEPKSKRTWKDFVEKDEVAKKPTAEQTSRQHDLNDYLRKGADMLAVKKAKEKEEYMNMRVSQLLEASNSTKDQSMSRVDDAGNLYRGQVLFACAENQHAYDVIAVLEDAYFTVTWVKDGRDAMNRFVLRDGGNSGKFDCLLVERDLPLADVYEVTETVRDVEKKRRKRASSLAAANGLSTVPPPNRHPIICFTAATSPQDLKSYMKADMDGCVSFPITNKASLLNTVRAAIPHHLAMIESSTSTVLESPVDLPGSKVFKTGALGVIEGSLDSATLAAKSMSISTGGSNEDCSFGGFIQIDADTRIPYTVMDAARRSKMPVVNKPFFNLVVCHDLFDTEERMKIFLRPIAEQYLGLQILLWNYPGQAFTEWREEQLLNNEYISICLNELLGQVGDKGTRDFDTSRPFYIMGYGYGANIAAHYASHYRVNNLRGLIQVNSWTYLDSYLAGLMHDCVNVFESSPSTRPDLPVYFFSRFLFSKDYLARVSVPLALNIYTAVHNPISLAGRVNLCKGILRGVDLRPVLREIDCPIICLHSTQDALARPMQTDAYSQNRGGEVRSVFRALKDPTKTCVIWFKGGHEIFQENKKQAQTLIEQLLTGFHETHDISFPSDPAVDRLASEQGSIALDQLRMNAPGGSQSSTVEDKFIDNVLGNVSKLSNISTAESRNKDRKPNTPKSSVRPQLSSSLSLPSINVANGPSSSSQSTLLQQQPSMSMSMSDGGLGEWQSYAHTITEQQSIAVMTKQKEAKRKAEKDAQHSTIIDPHSIDFGRQDSIHVKKMNELKSASSDYPEVKEYMAWRLKRNKKRLQRLQGAARVIQGGFRAYVARQFVKGIRKRKAATCIQRHVRGWLGRCRFLDRARQMWGSITIQRVYRGFLGRKEAFFLRMRVAAAANIQRTVRGMLARLYVCEVRRVRTEAAIVIQAMCRRRKARKDMWRKRTERNGSTIIQRVFRGHLGRRRALAERDKYIFSRSQSQGIEFGRQMLLEHKLHATRLQSDVTLLTQEKVAAEEHVEALLEEISGFEEGVRTLEKEMHQLSKVESEAAAFMDGDSKYELREQKIRLDKEFGEMLVKIGNRKDMLNDLEKKLSVIDRARQGKEEELRTLERKLVVLLEEQQNELNAIKRKQDVRGALLAANHEEIVKATSGGIGSQAMVVAGGSGLGGGGGGPSIQEKRQAAQLMESTETLMKFGFMSMSMTYFSSLNMIKALRTVSAQDTVMAALADVHAQRAVGFGTEGGGGSSMGANLLGSALGDGGSHAKGQFIPDLKPGQLPGQEALRVSGWSVDDVAKWLHTISLGQYVEAFIDAAIDGEFLYDLNDDDLKNTLGIEHRLHRKKILNCVHRLKLAEVQRDSRLNSLMRESGSLETPVLSPEKDPRGHFPVDPFTGSNGSEGPDGGVDRRLIDGPKIPMAELFSFVRHSKLNLLKEALDYLPNKNFEASLVQAAYALDHGTVYVEGYERLPFHINKSDEFGNSMLSMACQNGNIKVCKYLVAKGANMNHQNKAGQTPGHFAVGYKFFDLSHWLFENGSDDTIENKYGLTAYDGLMPEGEGTEEIVPV